MDQATLDQIRQEVSASLESYMGKIREEVQFAKVADLVEVKGNHYYAKEGLYPTLSQNFQSSGSSEPV
ncbi:MAG: hypothetical protein IPP15_19260 [Saprospiraceae bacterium]|uniref:Uncharacterized protein n=1 Tax=Candidatus Opimibacter skivensis TaxID=2982028 RepID=A0A9D7XQT4_9BACT|nr:hypothetical protein [Candidatus Opimibacter skivensis]